VDAGAAALIPALRTVPNGVIVKTQPDFGPLLVCGYQHATNIYVMKALPQRWNVPIPPRFVPLRGPRPRPVAWAAQHPNTGQSRAQAFRLSLSADLDVEPPQGKTLVYAPDAALSLPIRGAPGDRVVTLYGTGVLEAVFPSGRHTVALRDVTGRVIMRAHVKACDLQFIAAAKGDVVRTVYGAGVLRDYRMEDRVFVVQLPWGVAFLGPDALLGVEKGGSKSACCVM
jgi:hypothetical protein